MRLLHQWLDHDGREFPGDQEKPTDAEIKIALEGVKCRCGTHAAFSSGQASAAAMMG